MTVAEVAAILKLNQQTVRNWIDAGTLPAYRVGRRVRVRRSAFDELVVSSYSGGAEPADHPPPSIWDGEIPPPVAPHGNLARFSTSGSLGGRANTPQQQPQGS